MKIKLYGRQTKAVPLLRHKGSFVSYMEAVHTGQMSYGFGNFMVETPGHVPTRSEQLCRGKSKRRMMLDTL